MVLDASDSLYQIIFPSWDNLYHRSLVFIEGLDNSLEAYYWILPIQESMSNEASYPSLGKFPRS